MTRSFLNEDVGFCIYDELRVLAALKSIVQSPTLKLIVRKFRLELAFISHVVR